MGLDLAKLIEHGGPSVIPLAATLVFSNIYLDAKPEIPLYAWVVTAMGILTIIAGVLFVVKWTLDWPDTSKWLE